MTSEYPQKAIDANLDELGDLQKKANEHRSSRQKKALVERLIKRVRNKPCPPVSWVIYMWGIHLCKKGTRHKKKLAFSTIEHYLRCIETPLHELASELDFLNLDPEHFADIYRRSIDYKKKTENKDYLAARLSEFHYFLSDVLRVEPVDWSEIYLFPGASTMTAANASLLTPGEYLQALEIICYQEDMTLRTRQFYAGILIFGYRFGLRIGDVFRLRWMDISMEQDMQNIVIDVRPVWRGEIECGCSTGAVIGIIDGCGSAGAQHRISTC